MNRFGSYWKVNYSQSELRPYRRAAERYLKDHSEDFWIAHALKALRHLMDRSGPVQLVHDVLYMLPPKDKARAALARLRQAEIPPERLLAIHLAVTAALREDPVGPGSGNIPDEYKLVQVAKAAHRLASGPTVTGKYPRSAGLMLRHLGQMLDKCCEHVAEKHTAAVLALKGERYGPPGENSFSHVNSASKDWFKSRAERAKR